MGTRWNRKWRACVSLAAALWLTACVTIALQPVEASSDKEAACINTQLGAEYLGMGHLELARTKLARALRQNSELAAAHWTNARLQTRLGRPGFAEQHFRTALELDPQSASAHRNFGVVLCGMGRLEETQVQFEQALYDPLYDQPETALTNASVRCATRSGCRRLRNTSSGRCTRILSSRPALYEMARLAHG